MNTLDIIRLSLLNIVRSKLKTILAVLAVAIGVAAVVIIATIGEGGKNLISNELDKMGVNGLIVYKKSGQQYTDSFTNYDINKIQSFDGVTNVVSLLSEYGQYSMKGNEDSVVILGAGDGIEDIFNLNLKYGRMLNKNDINHDLNVALVSESLANKYIKDPTLSARRSMFPIPKQIKNSKSSE